MLQEYQKCVTKLAVATFCGAQRQSAAMPFKGQYTFFKEGGFLALQQRLDTASDAIWLMPKRSGQVVRGPAGSSLPALWLHTKRDSSCGHENGGRVPLHSAHHLLAAWRLQRHLCQRRMWCPQVTCLTHLSHVEGPLCSLFLEQTDQQVSSGAFTS